VRTSSQHPWPTNFTPLPVSFTSKYLYRHVSYFQLHDAIEAGNVLLLPERRDFYHKTSIEIRQLADD
jgi:hypothetical protein